MYLIIKDDNNIFLINHSCLSYGEEGLNILTYV